MRESVLWSPVIQGLAAVSAYLCLTALPRMWVVER